MRYNCVQSMISLPITICQGTVSIVIKHSICEENITSH